MSNDVYMPAPLHDKIWAIGKSDNLSLRPLVHLT